MKGSMYEQAVWITTTGPEVERGALPYILACTVKSKPDPRRHSTAKREEEEKGACFLARAGLSSYLYKLRVMCVHLSI
jgi:hypothetical protein